MPASIRGDTSAIAEQLSQAHYRPEPPIEFVWDLYWQIRGSLTRDYPIKHQDILAASQLKGIVLRPWEVDLVFHWDQEFYEVLK